MAALVYKFLKTNIMSDSIIFANLCATMVVQQKGVTLIDEKFRE